MANTDSQPKTFVEMVLVLLEDRFPWLGTDRDASGSDTVDQLNDLHRVLRTAKRAARRQQKRHNNSNDPQFPWPASHRPIHLPFSSEVRVDTYHDYLRTYSSELGARIVEMYPPLQGPKDPIAPALKTLLRRPLPAQAMTITGAAKYLETEDTVRLVGECGTGKTLMSIGIAHAHASGKPYSTLVMCPPHLVFKWVREVLVTVPLARTFVMYDLRNGGDASKPHGIVEVRLRNGHAVAKGLKTTTRLRSALSCTTLSHQPKQCYFWSVATRHLHTVSR
jgi:hypothetical protein